MFCLLFDVCRSFFSIIITFFFLHFFYLLLVLRHFDLSNIVTFSTYFIADIVHSCFYIFEFLLQLLFYIIFPHSCISSPFPSFLIGFFILFMFHVCMCFLLCFCFANFFMKVPLCLQFSTTSCIFIECNFLFLLCSFLFFH